MNINRRSIITGLISFVAAPAIVRVESLMNIKSIDTISTLLIFEYAPFNDSAIHRLDVLYCRLLIKPEWIALA